MHFEAKATIFVTWGNTTISPPRRVQFPFLMIRSELLRRLTKRFFSANKKKNKYSRRCILK